MSQNTIQSSSQDRIWEYFQNEDRSRFEESLYRMKFLIKKLRKHQRVLNIGVGGGTFERVALTANIDVYSLDPSERAIDFLKNSFKMGEKAKVGYSSEIPFDSGLFDAVVVTEVLEHLETEVLKRSLFEISRVLKKGGIIIGTVPADEDLKKNRAVCPGCGLGFHKWGHEQSFDTERLTLMLADLFKMIEVTKTEFVPYNVLNWKGKIVEFVKHVAFLVKLRPGTNLFFKATKGN